MLSTFWLPQVGICGERDCDDWWTCGGGDTLTMSSRWQGKKWGNIDAGKRFGLYGCFASFFTRDVSGMRIRYDLRWITHDALRHSCCQKKKKGTETPNETVSSIGRTNQVVWHNKTSWKKKHPNQHIHSQHCWTQLHKYAHLQGWGQNRAQLHHSSVDCVEVLWSCTGDCKRNVQYETILVEMP